MQRSTSDQLIGIYRYYNKQGNFHYIKLLDNYENSLPYRGGIRNYDRFISLNGINIEQETFEQITKHFKSQLNLPVQILVCSPAMYHFYKSNHIQIHSNLSTVQHLKPVFDIQNENQCQITQLDNYQSNNQELISQMDINKSLLEDLPRHVQFQCEHRNTDTVITDSDAL
jgi:hypothetical protein